MKECWLGNLTLVDRLVRCACRLEQLRRQNTQELKVEWSNPNRWDSVFCPRYCTFTR